MDSNPWDYNIKNKQVKRRDQNVFVHEILEEFKQSSTAEHDTVVNPNGIIHKCNKQKLYDELPNNIVVVNGITYTRADRKAKRPKSKARGARYQGHRWMKKLPEYVVKTTVAGILTSRFNSPSLSNHNSLIIAIAVFAIMMGFTTNLASFKFRNKHAKVSRVLGKVGLASLMFGCVLSISLFLPPQLEWIPICNAIFAGLLMLM